MGAPYPILDNGLATSQGIWDESTTPVVAVGTRARLSDGRVFYYAKNSSTAIVAGNSLQAELQTAQFAGLAVPTSAIGATSVSVTLGSTAVTVDEYKEGYLCVIDELGEGVTYKISGHPAADGSAACVFTLYEPINVTFHADTTVSIFKNPWCDVIIAAAGDGFLCVGVSQTAVTAGTATVPYYFWCQTWGISCAWHDLTTAVGVMMSTGATTAGQFDVQADGDQCCALNLWTVTTQGENNPVWLTVSA